MDRAEMRRACRHSVSWPARIRSIAEQSWHTGEVINLSVTGVLLHLQHRYGIGERVEVEIDFLTQPDAKTVVSGVGRVVREEREKDAAAIHFDLGCSPKSRNLDHLDQLSSHLTGGADTPRVSEGFHPQRHIDGQYASHHELGDHRGARQLARHNRGHSPS
jgi:hypothetical protein